VSLHALDVHGFLRHLAFGVPARVRDEPLTPRAFSRQRWTRNCHAAAESGAVDTIDTMLGDREVAEEASRSWWIFLLTGIAWLVFALLVFQWDYTTIYAVSYLFGVVALFAGANEFLAIAVSTAGWKLARAILGILFCIGGIWALVHPHAAFERLAALIGFFYLFKGIFDVTVAALTKSRFDLWWLQLTAGIVEIAIAFWVAGSFREKAILLVVSVGVIALIRGITELVLAFKLKGGPPGRLAVA